MTKRTTSSEEIERVAERMFNSGKSIGDRNDFNKVFAKNIAGTELTDAQKEFRENVFKQYEKHHGETLGKEREKENIKALEKSVRRQNIDIPARERTKSGHYRVVFAEKTTVIINKKEFTRYRDSKGRFASVKKRGN